MNECTRYNEELSSINSSTALTESGKDNKRAELIDSYARSFETSKNKVEVIIEQAITLLTTKRGNSNGDTAYQLRLQNFLNLINTTKLTSVDDFRLLLSPFKDDFTACLLIRSALVNSKQALYTSYMPEDNYSRNVELLNKFKDSIVSNINAKSTMLITYQIKDIENTFNDDLSLAGQNIQ